MSGIATSIARQILWKSISTVCARSLSQLNLSSCFTPFVVSATASGCPNESEDSSLSHDAVVHHGGRGSPGRVVPCVLWPPHPRGSHPTEPPVIGNRSTDHR